MGASPLKISAIVPARNAAATIGSCIEALHNQDGLSHCLQVLVIDDGSDDDTARLAREAGAAVVSILPSGPAAARNRGVEAAEGDLLVFTDADCIPDRDWLVNLVSPFEDSDVSATKGTYRTEQTSLTARFVQREYESRYRRMRRRQSIDFVDTYAAAFRRLQFFRVGGYDESFPNASVEDQEFSFRYGRSGGRMVFVENAVVRHLHADRPWSYFRKKLKIAFWKMRVLRRHPDKIVSDSHTPANVKLEMATALAMLLLLPFLATFVGQMALLALSVGFLLSCAPLALAMARVDGPLGVVAPAFCLLRAVALGFGCVAGLVASARVSHDESQPVSWLRERPADRLGDPSASTSREDAYETA